MRELRAPWFASRETGRATGARTRRIETTFSDAERTERTLVASVRTATTWCTARTREGNREEREKERENEGERERERERRRRRVYKRQPAPMREQERRKGRKRGCRISRTKESKEGPEATQCALRQNKPSLSSLSLSLSLSLSISLFTRENGSGPARTTSKGCLSKSQVGRTNQPSNWQNRLEFRVGRALVRRLFFLNGHSNCFVGSLCSSPFFLPFLVTNCVFSAHKHHACLSVCPKFVRP